MSVCLSLFSVWRHEIYEESKDKINESQRTWKSWICCCLRQLKANKKKNRINMNNTRLGFMCKFLIFRTEFNKYNKKTTEKLTSRKTVVCYSHYSQLPSYHRSTPSSPVWKPASLPASNQLVLPSDVCVVCAWVCLLVNVYTKTVPSWEIFLHVCVPLSVCVVKSQHTRLLLYRNYNNNHTDSKIKNKKKQLRKHVVEKCEQDNTPKNRTESKKPKKYCIFSADCWLFRVK